MSLKGHAGRGEKSSSNSKLNGSLSGSWSEGFSEVVESWPLMVGADPVALACFLDIVFKLKN
jgi:hypothetical protein